ncbi:MAG: hypothetical protein RLZZ188_2220 [Verrucomicrobiota bacterium]
MRFAARRRLLLPLVAAGFALSAASAAAPSLPPASAALVIDAATRPEPGLQAVLEGIDGGLRARLEIPPESVAVGLLDLRTARLAWRRPDAIEYAASVPKVGILLAWFAAHGEAAAAADPATRRALGEMIKRSDNETATRFSRELGIARVQAALDAHGFYDAARGGGIWFGKHYGRDSERVRDPVGGHTHAAAVRQLLRFYLLLEQDRLLSAAASAAMRDVFRSPEIPQVEDRFVKGLAGREREIRRKSGWWEEWSHDTAVVSGGGRHYLLVALTRHPRGTAYLEGLVSAVDDALAVPP